MSVPVGVTDPKPQRCAAVSLRQAFLLAQSRDILMTAISDSFSRKPVMAKEQTGPRKPATKFPQLRKQMLKNAIPTKLPQTKFGPDKKGK